MLLSGLDSGAMWCELIISWRNWLILLLQCNLQLEVFYFIQFVISSLLNVLIWYVNHPLKCLSIVNQIFVKSNFAKDEITMNTNYHFEQKCLRIFYIIKNSMFILMVQHLFKLDFLKLDCYCDFEKYLFLWKSWVFFTEKKSNQMIVL